MQTLWARVAQVRATCKCSLCHSSPSGLSRRVNIPSSRRRITQGDFFLVFSSTIAFEAVVLDSARKNERARQWDRAIEEERARVLAVDMDQKQRIDQLLENAQRRAVKNTPTRQQNKSNNVFYRTNTLPDAPRDRPASTEYLYWDWRGVFEWSARCDELRANAGFQNWKGVPLNWLKTLSKAELQELLRNRTLLHRYYRGPGSADIEPLGATRTDSIKKLRTLEWSVLKMTLRLLQASYSFENVAPIIPSGKMANANELMSLASPLNSQVLLAKANWILYKLRWSPNTTNLLESLERPHFPNYEWTRETHKKELLELNQRLQTKIQNLKSREGLDQVLKLICMDLLNSTIPPDIHTFNLLLVQLCELKENTLVRIVLDSMEEAHAQHDEVTHATLLRFFTMTNDKTAFCCYLDKMCGKRRGFVLADPTVEIHPLIARQCRRFGNKITRTAFLARRNQEVYSSLLVGMLTFFKPRDAMYWYRAMINEGWRPTAEVLIHILSSCCAELDWDGGVAVWEQFRKEGIKLTSIAYEWMLKLCRSCGREDAFSDVLSQGIRHGALTASILDLPPDVLLGDVDVLLEKAEVHEETRVNPDWISKRLEQQFLEVEDAEHRYLIETALHQGVKLRSAAWKRLRLLSRLALKYAALKRARETYRCDLERLHTDIAVTTEEIFREVRVPASFVAQYRAAQSFGHPGQEFSINSKWQSTEFSESLSIKSISSEAPVNSLRAQRISQMFSPNRVEELLETAVG